MSGTGLKYLLVLLILWTGHAVRADIYKCVDADGTITYSDTGCPEGTREVEKRPEINAPTKELRPPSVPLENRLKRLWPPDGYQVLTSLPFVLGAYGIMSLLCGLAIFRDKRKSINRQWRTSERTLHLLELLGGWPGSLVAQQVFRHKTRKLSYQVTFWCIVGLHGLVWADVLLHQKLSRTAMNLVHSLL